MRHSTMTDEVTHSFSSRASFLLQSCLSPADEPLAGFDYQYSRKEVLPLELLTCKSISNNVIHGEPTVSEEDVSKCMHSHIIEKRSTELDAVEEENEIKDENQNKEPLVLTKRSSRKLRAKLKETLIVHEEPLVSTKLSLRKLRAKLKETLIAHEVEELASLIKDNLYSKHLVLSTEEALITLLHQQSYDDDDDDHRGTVSRNTIELQPASSYHRLLLHRLADIYGFAHESVGEGEDRHLVLQRCPETAIPPVLVSDVLWQYDSNDVSASVVLTRNDTDHQKVWKAEDFQEAISVESSHLKADTDLKPLEQSVPVAAASLREREAAYRAARERIFSAHDAKGKDTSVAKPRHVPVVAQRMIAHALGKKVENPTETAALVKDKGKEVVSGPNIPTSSRNNLYAVTAGTKEESYLGKGNSRSTGGDSYRNPCTESKSCRGVNAEKLKKEEIGAAKRMFAHALRLPAVQGSEGAAAWKPK